MDSKYTENGSLSTHECINPCSLAHRSTHTHYLTRTHSLSHPHTLTISPAHTHSLTGYTDDVLEYIRVSVPKTMLADLKDSVKNERSLNIQDRYGATAVSTSHPTP